ncbi:hypothetical protein [Cellulosimicrobium cellulans]|uniref:hypothetical protein n=1 Tax=Cellulosimicrobium cellulans TaxID=1710 RepID=UPI003019F153
MTRGRWVALGALVAVLVAAAVAFVIALWDTRDEIPQSTFLPNEEGDPFLLPGAHDATSTTCTDAVPCRWAVEADTATVMMFDSQDDAEAAANDLPDARRSNWIVVQFEPGVLTGAEQHEFMSYVEGFHTSG